VIGARCDGAGQNREAYTGYDRMLVRELSGAFAASKQNTGEDA
jgi:hypothetical protein